MKENKRIAVFLGTFDPMTLGHTDIIKRSLLLFDELHVLIARNPEKKTMFSEDERLEMLRAAIDEECLSEKVLCEVWERPVFEYCRRAGAKVILKGIRNASDFDYEKVLAKQTKSLDPQIETVSLFADPAYDHISSTYVRGCIEYGFELDGAVPESVRKLIDKYKK